MHVRWHDCSFSLLLVACQWLQFVAASTVTSGDVEVVVMDQVNNPEWSATCSSDYTYPSTNGFCNTLEGPEGPTNGQHLQLGLQYPIAMSNVNENQAILCNVIQKSPARVQCQVLVRSGNILQQASAGAITLLKATAKDVAIAVMATGVRYLACYIYDAGGSSSLECTVLTMAGSSLNSGGSVTLGNTSTTGISNDPNSVQVVPMHTDKVMVCYSRLSFSVECVPVGWESSDFDVGTTLQIQESQVRNLVATQIFDQKAIVCYLSGPKWDQEVCTVLQSSTGSSSLSQGSGFVVSNTRPLGAAAMCKLAAQQAALCYVALGTTSATCHSLTASGQSLNKGPDKSFKAQDDSQLAIAGLNSDRSLFCLKNPGGAADCDEVSGLLSGGEDVNPGVHNHRHLAEGDGSSSTQAPVAPTPAPAPAPTPPSSLGHNIVVIAGNGGSAPAPAPAQITNVNTNQNSANAVSQSQSQSGSNSDGRRRNGRRRDDNRRRRRRRDKSSTTTEMPWGIPWWGWFMIVNIPILVVCLLCITACLGGYCSFTKKKKKAAAKPKVKPADAEDKKALLDKRDEMYYAEPRRGKAVKRYYESSSSSGSWSSSSA